MYYDIPHDKGLDIQNNINKYDYNFIINIPKVNLNVKVYDFFDKRNNVDKGIYLVKNYDFSSMNGSLILASHSGNSNISYFKNLNKIEINDNIIIETNTHNYLYKVTSKYYINKNGLFRYNNSDKTIYLITCDKKNRKKQIVIKGNLINKTKKSIFL